MRCRERCLTAALVALVIILSAYYVLNSIIFTLTHYHDKDFPVNATNIDISHVLRSNTSAIPDYSDVPKITTAIIGGLGNVIFQYAAAFAIGKRNGFHPVFPLNGKGLSATFMLPSAGDSSVYNVDRWKGFTESRACAYDKRTENIRHELGIKPDEKTNVQLRGFYQSWKYFNEYSDELRRELTFHPQILGTAQSFLSQAISKHLNPPTTDSENKTSSPVLVGIHVRRGDMLTTAHIARGYTVASAAYIQRAMSYFIEKFPSAIAERRFMFVVASNDLDWAAAHVKLNRTDSEIQIPIVFSSSMIAEIDLAILASCNHTIATVGTFSWWAGWLAGGIVTYYPHFPASGTFLDRIFNANDHWKPEWIGLRD